MNGFVIHFFKIIKVTVPLDSAPLGAIHLFHHYHERTKRSFGGRWLRPGVRFLEYKK
jgi:hypothetical protein